MPARQLATSIKAITEAEWQLLRKLVYDVAGIALAPSKKVLLVSRLNRRLNARNVSSFTDYYNLVTSSDPEGTELQALVNAITTNKTEFFRERHHFTVLENWLRDPDIAIRRARERGLRVWCAASSTGEEPYTIAAVLKSTLSHSEWSRTSILATDLDTEVLREAQAGIYDDSDIVNVPEKWRARMFMRTAAGATGTYPVHPDLKARVQFRQLNLTKGSWSIPGPLDIVFCRNVLIYFDKPTQHSVVRRACNLLAPHGLMFLGHSEGLTGFELDLELVANTVYRAHRMDASVAPMPMLAKSPSVEAGTSLQIPFHVGEQGLVRLTLSNGFVLVFIDSVSHRCGVVHLLDDFLLPPGFEKGGATLNRLLKDLATTQHSPDKLGVKLLRVHRTVKGDRGQGSIPRALQEWLQRRQIQLTATRWSETDLEVQVELSTGRVLVRQLATKAPQEQPYYSKLQAYR